MANSTLGRFLILRTFVLVGLAGAAVGCGNDGNSLADFEGTWQYSGMQGTLTCPGGAPQDFPLGSSKIWRAGTKSDLVDVSSSCFYRYDVKDKTAAIQASQSCILGTDTAGSDVTESPTSWVFRLTSATTAEEIVSSTANFIDGTVCAIAVSATLDKISKD